jgi:hypothetical protein
VKQYWVVGGRYTGTDFKKIVGGGEEEGFGPFDTYEDAQEEWARLAWATVDDAHARYRIVERAAVGREARVAYWVVGGEYSDTTFCRIARGGAEEWLGPFESYADAEAEWSRLSWATVDDAHTRYRVLKAEGPGAPAGETEPGAKEAAREPDWVSVGRGVRKRARAGRRSARGR